MNHYDGPAFYRKFVHDGTINKDNKLKVLQKRKREYSQRSSGVTGFARDVQRANFGNFKPVKTSSSHIDLQDNPIARITANFKPRRHYGTPDQSTVHTQHQPTEFERISSHYQRLTNELTPNDSDVTLLTSSKDNDPQSAHERSGSLHFKLTSGSVNTQSSQSINDQGGFSRLSTKPLETEDSTSSNYSSSSISVDQLHNQSSSSLRANQKSAVETKSSVNSFTNDVNVQSQEDSTDVDKSENSGVDSSSSVEVPRHMASSENSKSNQSPLGHNFSSIMHDEGEDIKNNLALFNRSNSGSENEKSSERSTQVDSNSDDVISENVSSEDNKETNRSTDESQQSESSKTSDQSFNKRPNFVAQNPTNVQPSSDFNESDSDTEEHYSIQPTTVTNYNFPSHDLLVAPKHYEDQGLDDWILNKAEILNKTLKAFHVNAQVVDWTNGPTVTQFQVKLQLGVKVSKINHLSDDLKMALAAKDIRIQAPIPGKTTCGIEIPNPKPRPVMLSEVVNSKTFRDSKSDLTIALGVDLTGKPRVTDLRKMPHGLIAGATGSGKSVFINCMLVSLMYKATPQELKMILIDPKAVEFAPYNGIPYLLSPVISEPKQAAASLKWATKEMNQRYEKLAAAGVRNIEQFNQKAEKTHQPEMKMPYILIVIDELADLMMVAGDEIETYIVRITQKARAAGIHLVVATQRPSVDVITGTMKNNIPTRVAFMVSSQVDSRTIIDQSGAERLLGKGDMLYLGNGNSHPIRLQGCYVSNQEIDKVAGFARHQEPAHYAFHPGSLLKHVSRLANQDKLMPQVLAYIAKEKTVSTSKLQRVFSIGYNRAAKIIDDLEHHNYISGQEGSKPRDVYLTEDDYKKLNL